MAVTKIHPTKSTLKAAIDYICNPEKTDQKILVSSFGCQPEIADIEFEYTLSQSVGNKGSNLAHHLIQAFEPGEVSYEGVCCKGCFLRTSNYMKAAGFIRSEMNR